MARTRPAKAPSQSAWLIVCALHPLLRPTLTIHHVTRSNHVSTSFSICQRNLRHPRHTQSIINRSIFLSQLSTMTMTRVLAQAHIAGDHNIRELFPDQFGGEDDGSLRIVGGGTSRVFGEMERNSEEDDGFESFGDERGEESLELVDAPTLLSGERVDRHLCREERAGGTSRKSESERSISTERQRCRGMRRERTSASGSSVMKMGYMSMSFVRCRSA